MAKTIEELAKKRQNWIEANRENGFEVGIKRLLTELYPDSAHFIYELLQNAEDAHAQKVRFILHEDRIEFEHDGKRLFSIQDVESITSIGSSTKRDDPTNIGKFGVGFKAVFAYTDLPSIESGKFQFHIRDMVLPEKLNRHAKKQARLGQTRFVLPFNNPKKKPERACEEIETLLKKLDATTLLFLTHISEIEYRLPDSSFGYIKRIGLGDNRLEVRVQQPTQPAPSSNHFLKFDKEVRIEDEEAENEDHRQKTCCIAVAFALSPTDPKAATNEEHKRAKTRSGWELAPIESGRVCIYFPAEKETSNLRFHLHAPFASTVARASVRDCAGNDALRDHIAELLAESMCTIRDQGLLTVHALSLLPNDGDSLSEFYKPLMDRLITEFREKKLVPMKRGGHAAANSIFRGTRALSDLIEDKDRKTLGFGDDSSGPIWAANPPQRNQREDNFLSMLEIKEWTTGDLISSLSEMSDEVRAKWMGEKSHKWHLDLYELLGGYLDPKVPNNAARVASIGLVRISDGTYRKGKECYFPTEEVQHDKKFPRVAKNIYHSGKGENVHRFLEAIGVREVDEKVKIEALLNTYYASEESKRPNRKDYYKHLRQCMRFLDQNPEEKSLFNGYCFLMVDGEEGVKWRNPETVYMDAPFVDTGLRTYHKTIGAKTGKLPLSRQYKGSGIKPETIGKFAESVGAHTILGEQDLTEVAKIIATTEPELRLNLSRLAWKSLVKFGKENPNFLRHTEEYHKGWGRYGIKYHPTSLCKKLRGTEWVPQVEGKGFKFVEPCEGVAEKLPEEFVYQTGWQWLRSDLGFGKSVEERKAARRGEQEQQTAEYKRKEESAKEIGFESLEEAEKLARLKKENPEEFRKLEKRISARKEPRSFRADRWLTLNGVRGVLTSRFPTLPLRNTRNAKKMSGSPRMPLTLSHGFANNTQTRTAKWSARFAKKRCPFGNAMANTTSKKGKFSPVSICRRRWKPSIWRSAPCAPPSTESL